MDLALVLAGARSSLRTELNGPAPQAVIRRWARTQGLFVSVDADGFLALSRRPGASRRLLALDASPGDHVKRLGGLLGYPGCCRRAAERAGEGGIDAMAIRLKKRRHLGLFRAIRAGGYGAGRAFISHVPCGPSCRASLALANVVLRSESPTFGAIGPPKRFWV